MKVKNWLKLLINTLNAFKELRSSLKDVRSILKSGIYSYDKKEKCFVRKIIIPYVVYININLSGKPKYLKSKNIQFRTGTSRNKTIFKSDGYFVVKYRSCDDFNRAQAPFEIDKSLFAYPVLEPVVTLKSHLIQVFNQKPHSNHSDILNMIQLYFHCLEREKQFIDYSYQKYDIFIKECKLSGIVSFYQHGDFYPDNIVNDNGSSVFIDLDTVRVYPFLYDLYRLIFFNEELTKGLFEDFFDNYILKLLGSIDNIDEFKDKQLACCIIISEYGFNSNYTYLIPENYYKTIKAISLKEKIGNLGLNPYCLFD